MVKLFPRNIMLRLLEMFIRMNRTLWWWLGQVMLKKSVSKYVTKCNTLWEKWFIVEVVHYFDSYKFVHCSEILGHIVKPYKTNKYKCWIDVRTTKITSRMKTVLKSKSNVFSFLTYFSHNLKFFLLFLNVIFGMEQLSCYTLCLVISST